MLKRFATGRITVMPGVPTVFATVLRMAPLDGLDLSSLRMLTNAAAALPPAHLDRLADLLPGAGMVQMYGLTECTRVCCLDPSLARERPGSVGRAIPNTEAYVVDDDGRRLPPGQVGELVVRGAHIMRGYWGKPEATAARLRDGDIPGEKVLHTGDLFRADDDGYLYFVGRTDDVFKCKGEKVSPGEVERVLYELDARRHGAVAMSVKTRNVPADRHLRAAGFVRRDRAADDPIRFMVRCADDPAVCALVDDPGSWFITSADSDLEYAMSPAGSAAVASQA